MTLAELAGRTLCVGLPGDATAPDVLARLASLGPGGLVLFARSVTTPDATRALVATVRGALAAESFVAVDQEGGRVARLRAGAADMPSASALGAAGDANLAERAGAALAADVRRFGADLDFAPVADLALDPRSTVVGTRAFGDDPHRVAALVAALVRGLHAGGAGATLKHFPGHGASALDSHDVLPTVDAGLATLHARELVPFVAGLAAGARCVMTAHVVVRALDPNRPATCSPAVGALLRDELGFDGAWFTDCLEMGAVAGTIGTVEAAVGALAAGADVLVLSHTLSLAEAARDAVVDAVKNGRIPLARLEEAVARGDALRMCLNGLPVRASVDGRAVAAEVARRGVTVVRGTPLLQAGEAATVVSFEGERGDGVGDAVAARASLALALRTRGVRAELMRVPLDPDADMRDHLTALLALQGPRRLVLVLRRAFRNPAQRALVDALLRDARDAVVVCAAEPLDATLVPAARAVLCTYGEGEATFEALADVLAGRAAARGRLPVSLHVAA